MQVSCVMKEGNWRSTHRMTSSRKEVKRQNGSGRDGRKQGNKEHGERVGKRKNKEGETRRKGKRKEATKSGVGGIGARKAARGERIRKKVEKESGEQEKKEQWLEPGENGETDFPHPDEDAKLWSGSEACVVEWICVVQPEEENEKSKVLWTSSSGLSTG